MLKKTFFKYFFFVVGNSVTYVQKQDIALIYSQTENPNAVYLFFLCEFAFKHFPAPAILICYLVSFNATQPGVSYPHTWHGITVPRYLPEARSRVSRVRIRAALFYKRYSVAKKYSQKMCDFLVGSGLTFHILLGGKT